MLGAGCYTIDRALPSSLKKTLKCACTSVSPPGAQCSSCRSPARPWPKQLLPPAWPHGCCKVQRDARKRGAHPPEPGHRQSIQAKKGLGQSPVELQLVSRLPKTMSDCQLRLPKDHDVSGEKERGPILDQGSLDVPLKSCKLLVMSNEHATFAGPTNRSGGTPTRCPSFSLNRDRQRIPTSTFPTG